MHDEELKIMLHDYFDELLSIEEESDFQTLLMENRSLAIELGKLKELKRRLKNMPLSFDPPPKIINTLTDKLMTLESSKVDEKKPKAIDVVEKVRAKKKKKKSNRKTILSIFIIIVIFALGGSSGYYYYINQNISFWRVVPIAGKFKIEGASHSPNQISENHLFKLGENGVSEIYIKDKGMIHVNGKSEFKIINSSTDLSSIEFITGDLEYIPKPISSKFQIVIEGLIITSKNSKFRIFSDELGDSNLEILSNFLQIEFKTELYRFAHDYVVKIEADNVIRTPYSNKTSPEFIKLLSEYDYKKEAKTLKKIISVAQNNDALTLHFLLEQVTPAKRELIIEKLNSIIPLPYGVNKSDILILNQVMMNKWWDEIYATIY